MNCLVKYNVREVLFMSVCREAITRPDNSLLLQCNEIDLPLIVQYSTSFLSPEDDFWEMVLHNFRKLDLQPEGICCILACLATCNSTRNVSIRRCAASLSAESLPKISSFSSRQVVNFTKDLLRCNALSDDALDCIWRNSAVTVPNFPVRDLTALLVTLTKTQRVGDIPNAWLQSGCDQICRMSHIDLFEFVHAVVQFSVSRPRAGFVRKIFANLRDELITRSFPTSVPLDIVARFLADVGIITAVSKSIAHVLLPAYDFLVDFWLPRCLGGDVFFQSMFMPSNGAGCVHSKSVSFAIQTAARMPNFHNVCEHRMFRLQHLFCFLMNSDWNGQGANFHFLCDMFSGFAAFGNDNTFFWSVLQRLADQRFDIFDISQIRSFVGVCAAFASNANLAWSYCSAYWCHTLCRSLSIEMKASGFHTHQISMSRHNFGTFLLSSGAMKVCVELNHRAHEVGIHSIGLQYRAIDFFSNRDCGYICPVHPDAMLRRGFLVDCWRSHSFCGHVDDLWLGICWPQLEDFLVWSAQSVIANHSSSATLGACDTIIKQHCFTSNVQVVGWCTTVLAVLARSKSSLLLNHSGKFAFLGSIIQNHIHHIPMALVSDVIHWVRAEKAKRCVR